METDDAASLLRLCEKERQEQLLPPIKKNGEILEILSYPKESAGSIMQTEVCVLREGLLIEEAIESIRVQKQLLKHVFYVYVVDRKNKLLGFVHLDDLILGDNQSPISQFTEPVEHFIYAHQDQEEVTLTFSKYDFACVPVISGEHILLGQITYDDVQDVMEKEASEDLLAFAGVSGGDSLEDGDRPKLILALGRFPWLFFSIVSSLLTGYILTFFEDRVENAILFASFVPLVMNTTGNVGTQTAMILIRNFSLRPDELGFLKLPLLRELSIGFLLGVFTAILIFIFILITHGDWSMSLRLGVTLVVSMTSAALFGIFIPIAFKRLGVDLAIASGPLVTSFCDLLSVSLYLIIIIFFGPFF